MIGMATTAAVDITTRGAGLGWLGGVVVTGVVIGAILLMRNMNQRLRRSAAKYEQGFDPGAGGSSGPVSGPDDGVSPR
jgi:hypothetical protein